MEVSPGREHRAEARCGQMCTVMLMLFLQVTGALRVVLQARLLPRIVCLVGGGRPSERAALLAKCLHVPLGSPHTACLPHHRDSWLSCGCQAWVTALAGPERGGFEVSG